MKRIIVFFVLSACALILTGSAQDLAPTGSIELKIFDTQFTVNEYRVEKNYSHSLKLVSLHHDEQTGLAIAKEIVGRRGGQLFELVSTRNSSPTRNLYFTHQQKEYAVDPNRLFTSAGIIKDLRRRYCFEIETEGEINSSTCSWSRPRYEEYEIVVPEVKRFSDALLKLIKPVPDGAVVSIHNNSDRGFSLISYTHGGSEWKSSEKGLFFGKEDLDNFFLVSTESLFKKLVNHRSDTWDYNIVLQKRPPNPDDGSLSIYSGRFGWNYILVEAESYSGADRQRQMINRVIDTFEKSQ